MSNLEGMDDFVSNMRDVSRIVPEKGPKSLTELGIIIMGKAQDNTPVKTGNLRSTGTVHPVEIKDDEVSVTLSFGSEDVDYAKVVHEDLEARHTNGSAKFLEKAIVESEEYALGVIAHEMNFE